MEELEKQPNIIKQFMESPLGKEIKAILQPDYCDRHDVYEIRNACLGDCALCKTESVFSAVREARYALMDKGQVPPCNEYIPNHETPELEKIFKGENERHLAFAVAVKRFLTPVDCGDHTERWVKIEEPKEEVKP